jgi:hypothetical protein
MSLGVPNLIQTSVNHVSGKNVLSKCITTPAANGSKSIDSKDGVRRALRLLGVHAMVPYPPHYPLDVRPISAQLHWASARMTLTPRLTCCIAPTSPALRACVK